MPTDREDLTGQQFGEWTVLEELGYGKVRCKCSCGLEKILYKGALKALEYSLKCTHKNKLTIGNRYGKLKVIDKVDVNRSLCICDCGNKRIVYNKYLRNGTTTSCGCVAIVRNDLTGKRFDSWTVLKELGHNRVICRCDCGTEREIYKSNLLKGSTHSCGCASFDRKGLNSEALLMIKDKERFIQYIQDVWKAEKPTMYAIADKLNISYVTVQRTLLEYGLHDIIDYKPMYSKEESEIIDYIHSITDCTIEKNNRKILDGKEIDIYIPDLSLAIEFNGIYWHSDLFVEREYHRNKVLLALKSNIRLIHIYENDWVDDRESIKNTLKNIIKNTEIYDDDKEVILSLDYDNIMHYIRNGYKIDKLIDPVCIYNTDKFNVYNSGYVKLKFEGVENSIE
jgi:hypothetical protein